MCDKNMLIKTHRVGATPVTRRYDNYSHRPVVYYACRNPGRFENVEKERKKERDGAAQQLLVCLARLIDNVLKRYFPDVVLSNIFKEIF